MWLDHQKTVAQFSSPYKFTGKQLDEESGLYYFGARYLDTRYSRWMSTDPALNEYIPAAGKGTAEESGKLPGMGGVFNVVNFNLYHYGANNPVMYVDPDGRFVAPIPLTLLPPPIIPPQVEYNGKMTGGGFYRMPSSTPNTLFPLLPLAPSSNITIFPDLGFKRQLTKVFFFLIFKKALTLYNKAPGIDAIPEEDKDEIAQHSVDGGHGPGVNFDNPTDEGVKERINDILSDPDTWVKVRKRDGAKLYMASDGTVLIHNPSAEDKGSIYYPKNPEEQWSNFK